MSGFERFLEREGSFWKSKASSLRGIAGLSGVFYFIAVFGFGSVVLAQGQPTDKSLWLIPAFTILFGSIPWGLRWSLCRRYKRELNELRSQQPGSPPMS